MKEAEQIIAFEMPGGKTKGSSPSPHWEMGGGPLRSPRGRDSMLLLLEALDFSRELGRPPWDFAVEIQCLREFGLTNNDFRWLLCKGYVEHGREMTPEYEVSRVFQPRNGLIFDRCTCFVLTQSGAEMARLLRQSSAPAPMRQPPPQWQSLRSQGEPAGDSGVIGGAIPRLVPQWDRHRQELRVGRYLVKQFKVPAPNQERILAVFEEEGWPVRIDDPIPPHSDQEPKRRLHDTIKSLNRNQKHPLLRFTGDGSGQGVLWSLLLSENGHGQIDARD